MNITTTRSDFQILKVVNKSRIRRFCVEARRQILGESFISSDPVNGDVRSLGLFPLQLFARSCPVRKGAFGVWISGGAGAGFVRPRVVPVVDVFIKASPRCVENDAGDIILDTLVAGSWDDPDSLGHHGVHVLELSPPRRDLNAIPGLYLFNANMLIRFAPLLNAGRGALVLSYVATGVVAWVGKNLGDLSDLSLGRPDRTPIRNTLNYE